MTAFFCKLNLQNRTNVSLGFFYNNVHGGVHCFEERQSRKSPPPNVQHGVLAQVEFGQVSVAGEGVLGDIADAIVSQIPATGRQTAVRGSRPGWVQLRAWLESHRCWESERAVLVGARGEGSIISHVCG